MIEFSMLVVAMLGFASLALGMERPQEDLFGGHLQPSRTRMVRLAGWVLLALSLAIALRQPQWGYALVKWFGCLSAGAGIVFVALVWHGRVRTPRAKR